MRQGKLTITMLFALMASLLILPGALRADTEAASIQLEKLVPKDTLAYVSVPNVKAFATSLKKSFFYALWYDEGIRKAFVPLYEKFDRVLAKVNEEIAGMGIEIKIEDLLDTFGGQLSFALIRVEGKIPICAAKIDVTANEEKLKKAISVGLEMLKKEAGEGLKVDITERAGQPIYKLTAPDAPFPLYCGFAAGSIFFANDETVFNGLMTAAEAGGIKDSLADNELYKKVKANVLKDGTPLTLVYCDVEAVVKLVVGLAEAEIPEGFPIELVLKVTDYVNKLGWGSVASGDYFIERFYCYSPEGIKIPGVCMTPLTFKSAALAPANSIFYSSMTCDPKAFIDWLLKLADDIDEGIRQTVEAQVEQMKEPFGFDVLADFVGSIAGEMGLFVAPPPMGGFIPSGALFIEIKDKEKFKSCIEKLKLFAARFAEGEGMKLENLLEETSMSNKETMYTFPFLADIIPDMVPVDPACGMVGDYFIISISPQMLKSVAARTVEKSFAASPALTEAKKHLLPNSSAAAFVDVPTIVRVVYDQGLGLIRGQFGNQFKLAELPVAEKIAAYFKPMYYSAAFTKDGAITQTVGNSGPGSSLSFMVLPIIAAVAIPTAAASRQEADVTVVVGNLRMLVIYQKMYKARLGTYATLIQLVEEEYIDPELGMGEKYGYTFIMKNVGAQKWECAAIPVEQDSGKPAYFVDETGTVRYTPDGSMPSRESPEYEE
ncbi:MAG: hypothetical protein E3J72_15085 [Planctomycetota bacterium]|nr:MAG: hypothetical protein E3J72_15085 [Planctomycetota bacterium]